MTQLLSVLVSTILAVSGSVWAAQSAAAANTATERAADTTTANKAAFRKFVEHENTLDRQMRQNRNADYQRSEQRAMEQRREAQRQEALRRQSQQRYR